MTEDKRAYEHETRTSGVGSPGETPSTEHREGVRGQPRTNEIDPDRRRDEPAEGPATRQDTRFTTADEA